MAGIMSHSSDGSVAVSVEVDWSRAEARGALFFKAFERRLEANFRHVLTMALAVAKARAPKGDRNYAIEDLQEITRAGGSRNARPANPRGFAVTQGDAKWRIRKIPGGTLRRALTLMVIQSVEHYLEGRIGVRAGSPAERYARITELGGTIAVKRAKYLRYSPDGKTVVFKPVVHRAAHPYIMPALVYVWSLVMDWLPKISFEEATAEIGLL